MNILLLFFALPVATIILSIVLEKLLRCPVLTAATFFAIYLIITFAVFDSSFLVLVIAYTILSFITAIIVESFFWKSKNGNECLKGNICSFRERNNNTIKLSDQEIRRIAEQLTNMQRNNTCCQNNNNSCNCINDVATVNVTNNTTGGRARWCCYRR